MGMRALWLLIVAVALASMSAARPARAYCRTATCPVDQRDADGNCGCDARICDPPVASTCGLVPIWWPTTCLGFALADDGSAKLDARVAFDLLMAGFTTWETARCPDGQAPPGVHVTNLGTVACARAEYNEARDRQGNINVLVFQDEVWPHEQDPAADLTLALTTVTFDLVTGEIFDADLEVNTAQAAFDLAQPGRGYDLASVMVHEAGHVLGLAHCADCDGVDADTTPTMYDKTLPSGAMRSLELDDVEAICAAHPPDDLHRSSCNPIPRHGYASECGGEQYAASCGAAGGRSRGSWGGWLALVGTSTWLGCRRRRA